MNTVATTAMTAQELHAAIVDGKVSVTEAKAVLRARIAKAEAEGRKPRAPSVQLLKELEDLKPRAKPTSLVNPVDALKAAKAAKQPQPAKQAPAKAADANADALSNEQLLDLLRERAASDKSFLSSVGMLFVELTQAK
ncbi:hypothetical protein [Aeromonas veronii]|uniref:hypothetical protein n=1 Tax=Aeromonas veronii TaxID=654 RepID=UPI00191E6E07|nr:hypothetical protein [Aeromonas veronii]MBL0505237.1 hypothetical protein [Aeromonas veronii]MCR3969964.1 hypothetical protein [Aeromonas veronii]MCR3974759.1 hypothetical protein [Aeromonas veronii]MDD1846899.1 hypothetical protein [Aeromonas veronii]HDZ8982031.1 hypothetical protein [Aeromonas veronii]